VRDQATITKNQNIHPNGTRQQATGFRGNGNAKNLYVRPYHWRFPEEGGNNKRIINNKPYTFDPATKRWDLDTISDGGYPQLPAANIAPPAPPPPTMPAPSPAASNGKGAFFAGYGDSSSMDAQTHKLFLAFQMHQMKAAYNDL
jgi:hypothetical protein